MLFQHLMVSAVCEVIVTSVIVQQMTYLDF